MPSLPKSAAFTGLIYNTAPSGRAERPIQPAFDKAIRAHKLKIVHASTPKKVPNEQGELVDREWVDLDQCDPAPIRGLTPPDCDQASEALIPIASSVPGWDKKKDAPRETYSWFTCNIDQLCRLYQQCKDPSQRWLFAIALRGRPLHLFLDMECEPPSPHSDIVIAQETTRLFRQFFTELRGRPPSGQMQWETATTAKKTSLHFHSPEAFATLRDLFEFVLRFVAWLKKQGAATPIRGGPSGEEIAALIDATVYSENRNMRLIGACKPGKQPLSLLTLPKDPTGGPSTHAEAVSHPKDDDGASGEDEATRSPLVQGSSPLVPGALLFRFDRLKEILWRGQVAYWMSADPADHFSFDHYTMVDSGGKILSTKKNIGKRAAPPIDATASKKSRLERFLVPDRDPAAPAGLAIPLEQIKEVVSMLDREKRLRAQGTSRVLWLHLVWAVKGAALPADREAALAWLTGFCQGNCHPGSSRPDKVAARWEEGKEGSYDARSLYNWVEEDVNYKTKKRVMKKHLLEVASLGFFSQSPQAAPIVEDVTAAPDRGGPTDAAEMQAPRVSSPPSPAAASGGAAPPSPPAQAPEAVADASSAGAAEQSTTVATGVSIKGEFGQKLDALLALWDECFVKDAAGTSLDFPVTHVSEWCAMMLEADSDSDSEEDSEEAAKLHIRLVSKFISLRVLPFCNQYWALVNTAVPTVLYRRANHVKGDDRTHEWTETTASQFAAFLWSHLYVGPVKVSKAWLTWPGRRQYFKAETIPPLVRELHRPTAGTFNRWAGIKISHERALRDGDPRHPDCALLQDYIMNAFLSAEPSPAVKEYFLKWWISQYVRPGFQLKAGLGLYSEARRLGKGGLFHMLSEMVGKDLVAMYPPKEVLGNFNGPIHGKTSFCLDEFHQSGGPNWADLVKTFLTEPEVSIRKLNTEPFLTANITNYYITTNHKDAMSVKDFDGRLLMLLITLGVKAPGYGHIKDYAWSYVDIAAWCLTMADELKLYEWDATVIPPSCGATAQKIGGEEKTDKFMVWLRHLMAAEEDDSLELFNGKTRPTRFYWSSYARMFPSETASYANAVGHAKTEHTQQWLTSRLQDVFQVSAKKKKSRLTMSAKNSVGATRVSAKEAAQSMQSFVFPLFAECRRTFYTYMGEVEPPLATAHRDAVDEAEVPKDAVEDAEDQAEGEGETGEVLHFHTRSEC